MSSPYSSQLRKFNHEPIFEILRDKKPWNDDLPIGAKLHFSFGIRKAKAILHAESVIRTYVHTKGTEPRTNTPVNLGYVPNTNILSIKVHKVDSFINHAAILINRSYLKLVIDGVPIAFGLTKAEALLELWEEIRRFVTDCDR